MGSKVPPMTPMRRLMTAECSALLRRPRGVPLGSNIAGGYATAKVGRDVPGWRFCLASSGKVCAGQQVVPRAALPAVGPTRVEGERRMARIELQDVSKVYTGGVRAVNS